jgi:hypothetical protein
LRRLHLRRALLIQRDEIDGIEQQRGEATMTPPQTQPAINIQINVGAQQLAQTDYEISLKLEGSVRIRSDSTDVATISRANGNNRRGHSIMTSGCSVSAGTFWIRKTPANCVTESVEPAVLL